MGGALDGKAAPIEGCDEAFQERIFRLNVYGVFHCTRAAVRIMETQEAGRIIHISSSAFHDQLVHTRCIPRREIPQDMVGGVVFLAGPGSDFMTGQILNLNLDGGLGLH